MTDRISGFTVVLEVDFREDSAVIGHIQDAIRMIKGVQSVKPQVSEYAEHVANERRDGAWLATVNEFVKVLHCSEPEKILEALKRLEV